MAEFLRTSGISHHIEEIIISAKEKLVILSPYLKLTENLFERLNEKKSENLEITLVYGKAELTEVEKRKLNSLENLNLYFYKNLHAKCYFNESHLLITSMNLHEFSEKNNREMGVLLEKATDNKIFIDAEQEAVSIIKSSILEKKSKQTARKSLIKIKDFEFKGEEDISMWLNKLQELLKEKYNLNNIHLKTPLILSCGSFLSDDIELRVEPEPRFMRIDFRFHGRGKKDLYYTLHANGRNILEEAYPEGVVNWGSQMMRLKLDFTIMNTPDLFKFDKNALLNAITFIDTSSEIIKKVLIKNE